MPTLPQPATARSARCAAAKARPQDRQARSASCGASSETVSPRCSPSAWARSAAAAPRSSHEANTSGTGAPARRTTSYAHRSRRRRTSPLCPGLSTYRRSTSRSPPRVVTRRFLLDDRPSETMVARGARPASCKSAAASSSSVVERHHLALEEAELEGLAGQVALRAIEELFDLAVTAGDARDGQPRPLPQLVVVDFGDRRAEAPLQLRLDGQQLLALALQRAVLGKVQLGREDADVAGAQGSYAEVVVGAGVSRSVRSTSRVS